MKCGYVKTINNLQFYFESSLAKKKKKMILDLIPRILGKLLCSMKSKNLWTIRIGLCSSISLHLHSYARLTNDWANQFRGCLNFSEVYSFRIFLLVLKENLKFLITHTSLSLSALGSFFSFFFSFNLSFSLLEKKKKIQCRREKIHSSNDN